MGLIVRSTKAGATTSFATSFSLGNTLLVADLDADLNVLYSEVNGNLDSNNLAANAVTNAKIADGAVSQVKIIDLSIGTSKIVNQAVTTTKLADLSVTTGKIVDANVTLAKLAANSVDSSKIADGTIVLADLAAGAAFSASNQSPAALGVFIGAGVQGFWVAGNPILARGSRVFILGDCAGVWASGAGSATVTVRIRRNATIPTDGTIIATAIYPLSTAGTGNYAIPFPSYIDVPGAGVVTYSVTVELSGGSTGAFSTSGTNAGTMWTLEIA